MARTPPAPNGCTTLVRPLGTILPVADATMSIVPTAAHSRAAQNKRPMTAAMARPMGDGGVSMISSAAGKNASSSRRRARTDRGGTRLGTDAALAATLADFMDACLQPVQRCIAAACLDQCVMGAVLDQTPAIEGHDAIRRAYGREPVSDDENRAPAGDLLHVLLDDALALVIEGAGGFV